MEEALSAGPSLSATFSKFMDESFHVQVSDAIAPRFNHDRCERSVQMRLYTMGKQQMTLLFSLFGVAFSLALFLGLAGPPITATLKHSYASEPGWNESKSWNFRLKSPHMSRYAQQLWIMAQVVSHQSTGIRYERSINIVATVKGLAETDQVLQTYKTGNRTHRLACREMVCDEMVLIHLGVVEYPHYDIDANIYGMDEVNSKFGVDDVVFFFKSYNPSFTKLEIYGRFTFAFIIFIITAWYLQCLRGYAFHYWALEQRWLAALLPLLLLYDNPLFPLVLVWDGWLPRVLDATFQATFLCALLLFWLCVYHGIRQNNRKWGGFYMPKLLLVGLIWFAAVSVGVWDRINELHDPGWYSDDFDVARFQSLKTLFLVLGGIYVAYLLYLLIRAYAELRHLPYFDLRLKLFTGLMLVVIGIVIALSLTKWGITPSLEDALVSSLSTTYASSGAFMLFYAVVNLYGAILAFLYSPNPNLPPELFFKDNPGVTLLNDSEDELIFNSSDFGGAPDEDDEER